MNKEIINALKATLDIDASTKIALSDLHTINALMSIKGRRGTWLGLVDGKWQLLDKQPEIGGFYKTKAEVQEMIDELLSNIAKDKKKK